MYKLLIIDDEPIIRQGLRTIIDWNAYDIEWCGEAENGLEGLRLCRELEPDLVLVDIRMPGMDGLQMIREVRKGGMDCDFLVLSGYSDFTYAKQAIECGIKGYLLKPLEKGELKGEVSSLREIWREKRETRERLNTLLQVEAEAALEQWFCSSGAEGGRGPEQLERLGEYLELPWSRYSLLLLEDERRELDPDEKLWLKRQLRESAGGQGRAVVFEAGRSLGVLAEAELAGVFCTACLEEAVERFGLEPVYAAVGAVTAFAGTAESFSRAKELLRSKFIHARRNRRILPASAEPEALAGREAVPEDPGYLIRIAESVSQAIGAGNRVRVGQLVQEACVHLGEQGGQEQQIKSMAVALCSDILRRLHAAEDKTALAVLPTLKQVAGAIELQWTLDGVCTYLTELFRTACSREKTGSAFSHILEYVESRYGEDIRLEGLASLFNYNSSYLGKLFKSQTGRSFNAYLDDIRMKKARDFLSEGRKIYEVAALVGYANVDYFHLKFKKLAGESPSSYRERVRKA